MRRRRNPHATLRWSRPPHPMCRPVLLRLQWHRGERGVGPLPRHLDFRLLCQLLDAQAPPCPGYATVAVSATRPEPRDSSLRRCCDCSSCSVWSASKMVEERIGTDPVAATYLWCMCGEDVELCQIFPLGEHVFLSPLFSLRVGALGTILNDIGASGMI